MAGTQNSSNQNQTGFQALDNTNGAMTGRTITAGTGIGVTNGSGVAGNPTISLSSPVAAANGGTGVSSPTIHTLPVAQGNSAFNFLGPLTNGQLLIGSTGLDPVAATITAGTGISIVNAAGSITINSTDIDFAWTDVTGTTQAMSPNNGYLSDNAGLVTLTLPAVAAQFSVVRVVGNGAGGWLIAQNALQEIHFDSIGTTVGITGSLASTNRYNSITLLCVVANTTWVVMSSVGNILVT